MPALVPGDVVVRPTGRVIVEFAPRSGSVNWENVSIRETPGYHYVPPDEGQLWPRGDYAPTG